MEVTNFLTKKWMKQSWEAFKNLKKSHRGFGFHCAPPTMPLTSAFLAPPLLQKMNKAKLRASHIYDLPFTPPPGSAPLHWEVLWLQPYVWPDISIDVLWYVCRHALICLSMRPDMSVDIPWYVCRRTMIFRSTCPDMSVDMPWYIHMPWYVWQRDLICCPDKLLCPDVLTCADMLMCTLICWHAWHVDVHPDVLTFPYMPTSPGMPKHPDTPKHPDMPKYFIATQKRTIHISETHLPNSRTALAHMGKCYVWDGWKREVLHAQK
jgi:hypothetical protein